MQITKKSSHLFPIDWDTHRACLHLVVQAAREFPLADVEYVNQSRVWLTQSFDTHDVSTTPVVVTLYRGSGLQARFEDSEDAVSSLDEILDKWREELSAIPE